MDTTERLTFSLFFIAVVPGGKLLIRLKSMSRACIPLTWPQVVSG